MASSDALDQAHAATDGIDTATQKPAAWLGELQGKASDVGTRVEGVTAALLPSGVLPNEESDQTVEGQPPPPAGFLSLPIELRNAIYELALSDLRATVVITAHKPGGDDAPWHLVQQHLRLSRDEILVISNSSKKSSSQHASISSIARVNKQIAEETLPIIYGRPFEFANVGNLNLFLRTIKSNRQYLLQISLLGLKPYVGIRWHSGLKELLPAVKLSSITVTHVLLCEHLQKFEYKRTYRTTVDDFVNDLMPFLVQWRVKTGMGKGSVLDAIKVVKQSPCLRCKKRDWSGCLERCFSTGMGCTSSEMEAAFQSVSSGLRARIAEVLRIHDD